MDSKYLKLLIREDMTDEEFKEMILNGINEVETNQSRLAEDVFNDLINDTE